MINSSIISNSQSSAIYISPLYSYIPPGAAPGNPSENAGEIYIWNNTITDSLNGIFCQGTIHESFTLDVPSSGYDSHIVSLPDSYVLIYSTTDTSPSANMSLLDSSENPIVWGYWEVIFDTLLSSGNYEFRGHSNGHNGLCKVSISDCFPKLIGNEIDVSTTGIICDSSIPLILANTIQNANSGIVSTSSTPRIRKCFIQDNSAVGIHSVNSYTEIYQTSIYGGAEGIYLSTDQFEIRECTIYGHSDSGLSAINSHGKIFDTIVSRNQDGIVCLNSQITVQETIIYDNVADDMELSLNTYILSLDSEIDVSNVLVQDTSSINLYRTFFVKTIDSTSKDPAGSETVRIDGVDHTSDGEGYIKDIINIECQKTQSSTTYYRGLGITNVPAGIKALQGYKTDKDASVDSSMNQEDTIKIIDWDETTYWEATDLSGTIFLDINCALMCGDIYLYHPESSSSAVYTYNVVGYDALGNPLETTNTRKPSGETVGTITLCNYPTEIKYVEITITSDSGNPMVSEVLDLGAIVSPITAEEIAVAYVKIFVGAEEILSWNYAHVGKAIPYSSSEKERIVYEVDVVSQSNDILGHIFIGGDRYGHPLFSVEEATFPWYVSLPDRIIDCVGLSDKMYGEIVVDNIPEDADTITKATAMWNPIEEGIKWVNKGVNDGWDYLGAPEIHDYLPGAKHKKVRGVPHYNQHPDLPGSCTPTAGSMVFGYHGVVDKDDYDPDTKDGEVREAQDDLADYMGYKKGKGTKPFLVSTGMKAAALERGWVAESTSFLDTEVFLSYGFYDWYCLEVGNPLQGFPVMLSISAGWGSDNEDKPDKKEREVSKHSVVGKGYLYYDTILLGPLSNSLKYDRFYIVDSGWDSMPTLYLNPLRLTGVMYTTFHPMDFTPPPIPPIIYKPDLYVGDIWVEPSKPVAGLPAMIFAKIWNYGGIGAPPVEVDVWEEHHGPQKMRWFLGATVTTPIPLNSYTIVAIPWNTLLHGLAGWCHLCVYVDTPNLVSESNENNNKGQLGIYVQGIPF